MSIKYQQLSHTYNEHSPFPYAALKDINLEIKEESFTAIIGETGSGKSTLVQHLNALLIPSSGKVIVDDYTLTSDKKNNKDLKQLRKKVGLVFQFPEYQLFEETILKDVSFGPKNFGASEEEAINSAKKALDLVGIDASYYERNPFDLSGGQKRRVAIAGILAINPDILVLDEPTAGLDPQGAKEMMELFVTLNAKHHKTIVMVTHNMEHVLRYCDEVVVLKKGELYQKKKVKEFFNDVNTLNDLHLALPKVIELRNELIKHGFNIDSHITSLEELSEAIKEVIYHG